jgi:uncharacterized protein YodC (DUF2158 family)
MTMSDIKAGDVVCLKSGSPKMTVTAVVRREDESEHAAVVWFDDTYTLPNGDAFPLIALVTCGDQA